MCLDAQKHITHLPRHPRQALGTSGSQAPYHASCARLAKGLVLCALQRPIQAVRAVTLTDHRSIAQLGRYSSLQDVLIFPDRIIVSMAWSEYPSSFRIVRVDVPNFSEGETPKTLARVGRTA